jgi:hypothetical protein
MRPRAQASGESRPAPHPSLSCPHLTQCCSVTTQLCTETGHVTHASSVSPPETKTFRKTLVFEIVLRPAVRGGDLAHKRRESLGRCRPPPDFVLFARQRAHHLRESDFTGYVATWTFCYWGVPRMTLSAR